jgi:hypothetical protein
MPVASELVTNASVKLLDVEDCGKFVSAMCGRLALSFFTRFYSCHSHCEANGRRVHQ